MATRCPLSHLLCRLNKASCPSLSSHGGRPVLGSSSLPFSGPGHIPGPSTSFSHGGDQSCHTAVGAGHRVLTPQGEEDSGGCGLSQGCSPWGHGCPAAPPCAAENTQEHPRTRALGPAASRALTLQYPPRFGLRGARGHSPQWRHQGPRGRRRKRAGRGCGWRPGGMGLARLCGEHPHNQDHPQPQLCAALAPCSWHRDSTGPWRYRWQCRGSRSHLLRASR